MSDPSQPSKIIVDEDWKSQVQAEKQRLAEEAARTASGSQPAAVDEGTANEAGELPPASLAVLLSMLATQAMVCLGQIPDPLAGKVEVHLDQAKHFIDLLQMLEEKTKGNLSPDESGMLEDLLHELRMAFVAVKGRSRGVKE
jgi:hypothetical protein